jgi:hypothetical protein
MTGETDVSTADLAQPGGPRQPDRGDVDARTGERGYETAGSRAVRDPADQDTVEMAGGAPSTGSTRDDARPAAAPYPGRTGTDAPDRGTADRGMDDPRMADQGMADRGMADQGMDDRGTADRGTAERGTAERGDAGTGDDIALLDPQDAEEMRRRWSDTQARFVDDPREAVQTADGLVAELMQTLARSFSAHKNELEAHWRSGGDPDTEELRQALQRYRSFFDRLLSA